MLLVRLVLALLLSGAIVGRSPFSSSRPGPDDDPASDPGPEAELAGATGADEREQAEREREEREAALPDNARKRAPWLVRMGIGLTPLAGLIGLSIAVLGFLARNTGWQLPIVGEVDGEWPLGVLLISIAIWAVWLLWQVPRWQAASWRRSMELKEREIFDIENSSRATLGQILSGVAVLAGLIFAWQQLGNTSQSLFVSQEGQITDRFTRAVGQLGDDDLTIRLGGIYALERIARDSERDHETVMEILAAFARQRSAAEADLAGAEAGIGTPMPSLASVESDPAGDPSLDSIRAIPLDIDVVLKVISRRDSTRDGIGCIDLSEINLAGSELGGSGLDLTNVCLRRAMLQGAQLIGMDFSGADLAGSDFTGANLQQANLAEAQLHGSFFTGADLDRANLSGAQLTSSNLARANLSEANLTGATLTSANLQSTLLQGTVLGDADLNGADLSLSVMSGTDLRGANMRDVNLEGATMLGVDLRGATNLTVEQLNAANLDGTSQLPPEIAATPDF